MSMKIRDVFRNRPFGLSIEIFPPKTERGDQALANNLHRLVRYQPAFVSCTYGAGGSTQSRTLDWCRRLNTEFGQTATAHFTCVGATRENLLEWLARARDLGIENIMALRGDAPAGSDEFQAVEGGLRHANELVALIREHFGDAFGIGVAGYPEKHPEAPDEHADLANLKRKVEAGADAVFTQLFFDNSNFFRFRERYQQAGIGVPLVPGIMPITEFARIKRITAMCGSIIPTELAARLEAVQDDTLAQFEIGVEHAIGQCRALMEADVPGIHFYVLNKSEACEKILGALDMQPATAE
jgi:methylenetetrahydrofolate reductase (NADPH)